jgi:hypothetical protein
MLSLFSHATSNTIDTAMYKPMFKKIVQDLFKTYDEVGTNEQPYEVRNLITLVQNKFYPSLGKSDTSQNMSSIYVQSGMSIQRDMKTGVSYFTPDFIALIDLKDSNILVDSPKTKERLLEESTFAKNKACIILDSISDGNWQLNGNLMTIEKENKSENTIEMMIEYMKVVFNVKTKQLVSQEIRYKNSSQICLLMKYEYIPHKEKLPLVTLKKIFETPSLKTFKIFDHRSKN